MRLQDIAFFTNESFVRADEEIQRSHVPVRDRIEIVDEIHIEKLPRNLWQEVAKSCALGGHLDATRQFSQLYAFVRDVQGGLEQPNSFTWDHDERLQICIGISRVVYPTSISFEYSARVAFENGEIIRIVPGPARGFGAKAWLSRDDYRDWLTEDEAREISTVVTAYFSAETQLCNRVKQALWYTEYAFRTFFLDIRWPLICMGLESFIHTDRLRSTDQFAKRVSKIAEQILIRGFPEEKAREAYETRSALVHGQLLRDVGQYRLELYEKIEEILRLAIKKAILEPSFNRIFSSETLIRLNFPI